jgi:diguanylate cyclase (GGDEF)-like protein
VYVLLASPHAAKRALVEAAKAGSDGCLSTPIDLESLEAQLIVAARITRAYRALTESNLSLRHDSRASFRAARLDPLTHVSNRLRLDEDLETLQEHVSRYDRGVAIAMCDLDEFKRYNDHYGHLAGDVALQRVAHAIRKSLRRADPVYRYGGEEFLAILHEQARDDAALAVERARAAVHDLGIVHAPTAQHPVLTVSIGLAIVATEGGRSVHAAIARADHALYRAKAAGRNNVTLEDEPDHRSQDNPRDKVVHRVTGRRS